MVVKEVDEPARAAPLGRQEDEGRAASSGHRALAAEDSSRRPRDLPVRRGSPVGPRACAGASRARRDGVGAARRPPRREPPPRPHTRQRRRASACGKRRWPGRRRSPGARRARACRRTSVPSSPQTLLEPPVIDDERCGRRSPRRPPLQRVVALEMVTRTGTLNVLRERIALQLRPCPHSTAPASAAESAGPRLGATRRQRVETGCRPACDFHDPPSQVRSPDALDLYDRAVEARRIVDRRGTARRARSCARRRTARRPGAGRSAPEAPHDAVPCRHRAEHFLQRLPRGHQNSSASLLMTQSAPNSVAASRAMRVTHSPCRRPSAGSRIRWSTPSRAYRSKISVVPSRELLSVAMTKSAPALRWTSILRVDRCPPRRARGL